MNSQLPELIVAMVKLGLRHNAIAHSLGLTLHVLRQYFAPELIQTATQAELAALTGLQAMAASRRNTAAILFQLKMRRPQPPKPAAPAIRERKPFSIEVYNNDGEPNYH